MVSVGTGKYSYKVVEGWGKLPEGYEFGQVAGVATDSQGNVHLFNRSKHPIQVFDMNGKFLRAWGQGQFASPHGITIAPDNTYWMVDTDLHQVLKFSSDGKLQMTLGAKGRPSDTGYSEKDRTVKRAAGPFNRPTKVALGKRGEVYISDGYGNSRVHKYSSDGKLLMSWGEPGTGPGQFHLPHSIWVDKDERVLVCDRENHRIQVFTPEGRYITQWTGFKQPTDIYIDPSNTVYVSELGDRVSILDLKGNLLARWGEDKPRSHKPGEFFGAHGIWVCARGDIYVSEVLEGRRVQKFVRST
ncbi:MAG: hypothetical protein FJ320_01130 [SAR202 cluster bacterium]|nr:hypothetical protein [SAR202 cluster bacterium]